MVSKNGGSDVTLEKAYEQGLLTEKTWKLSITTTSKPKPHFMRKKADNATTGGIMKKIAFFFAGIILLGTICGCSASKKPQNTEPEKLINSPAPVEEETLDQIEKAYKSQFKKEFKLRWYDGETPSAQAYYCGNDNGYDILIFDESQGGLADVTGSVKICGEVEFDHVNANTSLYAYKDGEFIKLADAYNEGLVTKEGLEDASNIYSDAREGKITIETVPTVPHLAPGDKALDDAIITAFCTETGTDREMSSRIQVRHYLQMEDLYAVYVDGPWEYTQAIRTVTLSRNYKFTFPTGQKLYLYRNGEICALEDVEIRNFVTIYEIDALWQYHKEHSPKYDNDNLVTE